MALCKCGCGEALPANYGNGQQRQFLRGHRKNWAKARANAIVNEKREKEGKEPLEFAPPQADAFSELGSNWDSIKDPFQSLADSLPDDPSPDQEAREQSQGAQIITPTGQIVVTKQVANDIQGKLAFLLSMPSAMLMPLDPICFGALQDRIPAMSASLTPLICQSPDMVKFFTKESGFILWLSFLATAWPVIQTVIAHHLTKSITLDDKGNVKKVDHSQYAA